MLRTIGGASLLVLACCALIAQTAGKRPAFEVATVKPSAPNAADAYSEGFRIGKASRGLVIEGRRATVTYNTLRELVRIAYGVKNHQVSAPAWMASQHFDVAATLPEGVDVSQAPELLRALLEERFHLECHWEPRELAVFALVVGKGGFKGKPSEPLTTPAGPAAASEAAAMSAAKQASESVAARTRSGISPAVSGSGRGGGSMFVRLRAGSTATFADRLTYLTDRPVIDMTELPGTYDFEVTFASGESDTLPSLFTALQEQMGLKLEARKMNVKTVIVDRADKLPTEN